MHGYVSTLPIVICNMSNFFSLLWLIQMCVCIYIYIYIYEFHMYHLILSMHKDQSYQTPQEMISNSVLEDKKFWK